ncbi:polar amino acid transport system substrate-binding protein [Neisseria sp. HSC-16F19]|nr:basic amino acid ABC transporter substrate-binding protein [Neisseria sp. HSC-16F19]MCP2039592.1 polar amino acid transport system substrate-binding protein [Neisseria sp. HSC-16F19]
MFSKKALWSLVAAASLSLAACGGGNSGSSSAPAPASSAGGGDAPAKEYVVATDATYAPFEFEDGGQVVGFSREVLEAVGEKEGIRFKFVNTPWEGIFATLGKDDADIVSSSVTITEERKQSMDFTDPYFEATQMIAVTEQNADTIKSYADLKERRVSVQNGTTGDLAMQKLQGNDSKEIKRFETMPLALKELLSGGVDASVGDNGVVENFANNNPDAKLITFVDPEFEKEFYGFAVKKDRGDDLLPKLNSGIAAIKADGTYEKIYSKWFSGSKQ